MDDDVKSRPYRSPRRRQQAAATRRAILDAAERLFAEHGYTATTMAAVAEEAGVAVKTVYLAFETKSGVLRALWNLRLRGDEVEAPVGERDWFLEVLEEPDPERQLRLNARNGRAVKTRIDPVIAPLRAAALTDPEIAALYARIQEQFYEHQGRIVKSLHRKGALRPGLGVARATDILWALNHFELWLLLGGERGWSPARWERWFGDTAIAQLLRT